VKRRDLSERKGSPSNLEDSEIQCREKDHNSEHQTSSDPMRGRGKTHRGGKSILSTGKKKSEREPGIKPLSFIREVVTGRRDR